MIKLMQILKPVWFFSINNTELPILVNYNNLNSNQKKLFNKNDNIYDSNSALLLDYAYQALILGLIIKDNAKRLDIDYTKISVVDQYRFVRSFYKKIWVYYIFFVRVLTFNNFINEINAFCKSSNAKKYKFKRYVLYDNLKSFKSTIINNDHLVSVIIPTLNRYKYLTLVLKDLEKQSYKNFEVIIIDQSDNFDKNFYENFNLKIRLIRQKEKALWKARNTAILCSISNYLLFFDDDSRVNKNWINEHLRCIDFFDADISSGLSLSLKEELNFKQSFRYKWSDQLDTGNVMIKKKVFEDIGLFDRQFEKMRMGDAEFGIRAYKHGIKNIFNSNATRLHLKVDKGGLRQLGSWDAVRPTKLFRPRPIPSALYLWRKYWGDKSAFLNLVKIIPISLSSYRLKGKIFGYIISVVIFVFTFPLICYQVFQSWKKSTNMLITGSKIEKIK